MGDAKNAKRAASGGGGGAFLCLGFLGALVYYIQQAEGFWGVIVAILKAIVWPAFFVYDVLKFVS